MRGPGKEEAPEPEVCAEMFPVLHLEREKTAFERLKKTIKLLCLLRLLVTFFS